MTEKAPEKCQPMPLTFREVPRPADAAAVRRLVSASGFFRPEEVDVAEELVTTRLAGGEASGYYFVFAEADDDDDGSLAGYVCYGPTPCTVGTFDLYWIVVAGHARGRGLGRKLAGMAEGAARALGGRLMYAETSGQPLYAPTRAFYVKAGYSEAARLADFYDVGDDKVIFQKKL